MQATLENCELLGQDNGFPEKLKDIPACPRRLFVSGQIPDQTPVAVVGSRKVTSYGRRVTIAVVAKLANAGIPVVSGLAFGVDTIAHETALNAGGQTVAVLPSGLDKSSISPKYNLKLANQIKQRGALISEYSPGTSARKEHFSARNRLISGLSRAVVIVEAALPSGSLMTADHAAAQGREVWAVPGQIDSLTSAGTNLLVSQGAQPLIDVNYFLESLGVSTGLNNPSNPLLEHLSDQPVHIDDLIGRTGRTLQDIETDLTKLELLQLVRQVGGRYYVRT